MVSINTDIEKAQAARLEELRTMAKLNPWLVRDKLRFHMQGAMGQVGFGYLLPAIEEIYPYKDFKDSYICRDASLLHRTVLNFKYGDVRDNFQFQQDLQARGYGSVSIACDLAAFLSAAAEAQPEIAMDINFWAVLDMARIAKANGVKVFFVPSSIAALVAESDGRPSTIEARHGIKGSYGSSKAAMEHVFYMLSNMPGTETVFTSLRYPGVLTCTIPPSNGTTEQIDLAIVAAAEAEAIRRCDLIRGPINLMDKIRDGAIVPEFSKFSKEMGKFILNPAVEPEATFPMIDGTDVGPETLRFLMVAYATPDKIRERCSVYGIQGFSASMREVKVALEKKTPIFEMVFDPSQYQSAKVEFSRKWPKAMDTADAERDWGFKATVTSLDAAIEAHFERLVKKFVEKYSRVKKGQNFSAQDHFPMAQLISPAERRAIDERFLERLTDTDGSGRPVGRYGPAVHTRRR